MKNLDFVVVGAQASDESGDISGVETILTFFFYLIEHKDKI